MSEVLIVSKTRYGGVACIGGIDLSNNESIRLMTDASGHSYPPLSIGFEMGALWDIDYTYSPNISNPHTEDVVLNSYKCIVDPYPGFQNFLQNAHVTGRYWQGHPTNLFNGAMLWQANGRGYYRDRKGGLAISTGFWLPDKDLILDGKRYAYIDGYKHMSLSYAGFPTAIDPIPANTLVRVSLAKWLYVEEVADERCYLQLSGWY